MFGNITSFLKKLVKSETKELPSKEKAKERLHLVLMQDRANVSADFLELMKQEIIEVIKKYIEVEESAIDVRLTNEIGEDGTTGAPSLYANIPILNIKNDMKNNIKKENEETKQEDKELGKEDKKEIPEGKTEEKVDKKEEAKDEIKEENKLEEIKTEKEETKEKLKEEKPKIKSVEKKKQTKKDKVIK